MDKVKRVYTLHGLLHGRRTVVSLASIMEHLECSRATALRIIRELRDEFGAPVEFDRERGGYCYRKAGDRPFDLPGLWFDESELLSLLTMEQLLSGMGNPALSRMLAPARERVSALLGSDNAHVSGRIQVVEHLKRRGRKDVFEPVMAAILQQRRLSMAYHARGSDQTTQRTISPQRLVHFRSNWYLDAWCHTREDVRRFALDAIVSADMLEAAAILVPVEKLSSQLDEDYGAFTGQARLMAVLRFNQQAARWVADEVWHRHQQGHWLADGQYELHIPYSHDRELIMDILRHGDNVTVVGPSALRQAVRDTLVRAHAQYAT
ncbi:YafY family transcriptional regulator [Burkholderiaceae bacterium DAT-1]|nr:YafY family transcriptional regulator [Burkholderiaceae bacterium DAT-1]